MLLAVSGVDSIIQFITVLLIFAIVLLVTLFVTRWIGKYQKMQNSGDNVQVIESVRISPSVCVEILRIGKKYIAVAVAKENVTMLLELSEEDVELGVNKVIEDISFGSIFDAVKKGFSGQNTKDEQNDAN